MRDIVLVLVVFASIPFILKRPFVGILMWTWLSLMNPHKQAWGFARTLPLAFIVAIAFVIAFLYSKEAKRIPWEKPIVVLAVFWAWMLFTTFFALNPDGAWMQWDKVWRIQLFTFLTVILLTSKERILALVAVMTLSLGYYGVKGGIFTILTGGGYRVMGPENTFISGNNEIGLALIMTIPLMRFWQLQAKRSWQRWAMVGAMLATLAAILGTHSRGALLGLFVMLLALARKSRRKVGLLLLLGLSVPLAIMFMPEHWTSRMHTIQTYEEDASAMGRINAWWFAFNLAKDRPIVGGGFETFRGWIFARWAPDPGNYHDAHSIYFEVLGEHGFVGLALFLALGLMSLRLAGQVARLARKDTALQWMTDLASLLQVSLIGYATAGLFLGLAYFDFYYALVAAVVGCKVVLERHQHSSRSAEVATGAKRRETISAPLAPGAGRRLSSPRP